MGYYLYLNDHEFTLQASQFEAVLERWREFEKAAPPAYPSASVFYQYPDDPRPAKTVPDIFEEFGFEVVFDGEVMILDGWEGKAGYENEYIGAIADLIDEGWFLDWTGEDDDRWRMTATETTSGETVFIRPSLEYRLRDITKLLDEYDDGHPPAGEGAAAEVSAVGPIIDAVRALIADLT
jgi:hypothetical protein